MDRGACACGKVPYWSKGRAQEAKRKLIRRGFDHPVHRLNVYRCPTSKAWHVGHLPIAKCWRLREQE